MKSAIIILDEKLKSEKALKPLLDKKVIDFVVHDLKEAGADLVLVLSEKSLELEEATCVKSLYEAINTIGLDSGEVIILDDIYPFIKIDTYIKLYELKSARIRNTKIIRLNTKDLVEMGKKEFDLVDSSSDELKDIDDYHIYQELYAHYHKEINDYHLNNGVIILDSATTYIGPDVKIEKGVIIEGNNTIYGDSYIGSNTKIESGSYLYNARVGKDNVITSSRIVDSRIHDEITLGPYAHLRMNSEVYSKCRIGNFVEFKNTKFGYGSRCAHLTYLGDCSVGEDVNIGCGVVTVNYDGAKKHHTTIGDHAFIGSNANLVAPIRIGAYALVAAGSTVTDDIKDNDMAIARPYATVKEGYGYTYINKGRK